MKIIPEAILTLKTPEDWMELNHPNQKIMDPDGWRGNDKSFADVITEEEFERRLAECTIMWYKGPLR